MRIIKMDCVTITNKNKPMNNGNFDKHIEQTKKLFVAPARAYGKPGSLTSRFF